MRTLLFYVTASIVSLFSLASTPCQAQGYQSSYGQNSDWLNQRSYDYPTNQYPQVTQRYVPQVQIIGPDGYRYDNRYRDQQYDNPYQYDGRRTNYNDRRYPNGYYGNERYSYNGSYYGGGYNSYRYSPEAQALGDIIRGVCALIDCR